MAILFGLLAGLGVGSSTVLARVGLQTTNPSVATTISVSASLVTTGILALLFEPAVFKALPGMSYLWFLGLGILTFPIARLMNFASVSLIGAPRSASIISVQPLFTATLAIIFLRESVNVAIVVGTISIVVAMVLILAEGQNSTRLLGIPYRRFVSGCLVGIAAALCYGLSNTLAKEVVDEHGPPLVSIFFSLLFGSIVLFTMSARNMRGLHLDRKAILSLTSSGVLSGLGAVSYTHLTLPTNREV